MADLKETLQLLDTLAANCIAGVTGIREGLEMVPKLASMEGWGQQEREAVVRALNGETPYEEGKRPPVHDPLVAQAAQLRKNYDELWQSLEKGRQPTGDNHVPTFPTESYDLVGIVGKCLHKGCEDPETNRAMFRKAARLLLAYADALEPA